MVQGDLRGYLPDEGIQEPESQRSFFQHLADHFISVEHLSKKHGTSATSQALNARASISISASRGSLATSTVDLAGGEEGK